jgi:hypothetical protein
MRTVIILLILAWTVTSVQLITARRAATLADGAAVHEVCFCDTCCAEHYATINPAGPEY